MFLNNFKLYIIALGYAQLLSQLTSVGELTKEKFEGKAKRNYVSLKFNLILSQSELY